MNDLLGHAPVTKPFKDIANQRPDVAEEKARLCLELNALVKTPPPFAEFVERQPRAAMARGAQAGAGGAARSARQQTGAAERDQHDEGV